MTEIPVSSSMQQINPSLLFNDGFELENSSLIPNEDYSGSFSPGINQIEFFVYDTQKSIQYSDYNFTGYQITQNTTPNAIPVGATPEQTANPAIGNSTTNTVSINPETDIYNAGYNNGVLYGVYNFINNELSSSVDNKYYIAEISGDRTEIRIKSNYISNAEMKSSYISFENTLDTQTFFDEFYITFGENEYHIGVNSQFSELEEKDSSILIKLFDGLPSRYKELDEIYIVTKTAETQVFEVDYVEDLSVVSDTTALQGPNINLDIKDYVNNSTTYKNKNELLGTNSSGSKDQLLNILEQKGIKLTPNYTTSSFDQFVHFSSAKARTQNFYEKVSRIQAYENDIASINPITGSNPTVQISQSIAGLYTRIEEEIKSFDGWDYYLYYNTASDSYPKDTSPSEVFPYPLLNTGSTEVLNWLGSDVENDQYYGGVLYSASRYDNDNQNYLYYTIPTFITEQSNNDNYVDFTNMVGQSFDELWLYTKAITDKLNTTNVLDEGVPLSLADDVITSLGYTGFGNNYNNQDSFIGLAGNDDGVYVPPTGSELINHYIAVNNGEILNYWDPNYSWADYVEQLITNGWPYPIDDVSKEIFKRLYHNMSSLVKKKGTISGLRQLINIWGIPNTILRINEFGGKNKDQTDDYDLWYERYSYAYTPVANSYRASASAIVPWMPLERNRIADAGAYVVPDGVGFRFKTTGYPSSSFAGSFNSQSLAVKKSNGLDDQEFDWGIMLNYTGSTSGSYQGAGNSDYRNWAEMKFYISGAASDGGNVESDPIYLPFYDSGWWSVLLQRNAHVDYTNNSNRVTYTLYAKNKIYNGWDGNSLGFEGSASIDAFDVNGAGTYGTGLYGTAIYGAQISSSINYAWNKFGTTTNDGVYIGGRIDGAEVGGLVTNIPGQAFSGSFQEFRYYSHDISESVFNDFVMNPESIEGNKITGSESSFDIVNFRAPLGNELESFFTSSLLTKHNEVISSSHPAITASSDILITGSFVNPVDNSITSSYKIIYEEDTVKRTYSKTNTETYFLDQPAIGFRNRITNKIQNTKDLNFGTVLSGQVSIEKDPFISQSYTENLNQLEVAFSPQDEVNDDIIASLGYGAIQEVLADPRFRSSSDDYYPGLRNIAKNYFKKYEGSNVYDYLRLIKYFDDSLFKAIKNYVPARTSVSTGIVIHQNMLERNRYREPQLNSYTTQSYAITNIPLTTQNLELTGSIGVVEITGSAGGSVNRYNITGSQSGYFAIQNIGSGTIPPGGYLDLSNFNAISSLVTFNAENPAGDIYGEYNSTFGYPTAIPYLRVLQPVKMHIALTTSTNALTSFATIVSSSLRGEIARKDYSSGTGGTFITPLLDIMPEETIGFFLQNTGNLLGNIQSNQVIIKSYEYTNPPSVTALLPYSDISSSANPSDQAYIEYNQTQVGLLGEVVNNQDEFYDGEFSGSTLNAGQYYNTQYNPYLRVSKDSISNNRTVNLPVVDFTSGTTQLNTRLKQLTNISTLLFPGALNPVVTTAIGFTFPTSFPSVPITITSGTVTGTIVASVTIATVAGTDFVQAIFITQTPPPNITIGTTLQIPANTMTGVTSDVDMEVTSAALNEFSNITTDGFDVTNQFNNEYILLSGQPTNFLNNRKYNISFDVNNYSGAGMIGLSNIDSTGDVNLFTQGAAAATSNGAFSASFESAFIPNGSETLSARISVSPGFAGNITNFNITPDYASDSWWDDIFADVYLNPLQQDQWQIQNTQSIIFDNSDYNPLNNNVNLNRSSSTKLLLSYNDEQYQPENFQNIVTYSLDNTSQSIFADVPDSNYTQLASINPRYKGSRLESLDYNNYTPSGTIGEIQYLPIQRYNKKPGLGYQYSVAESFINGTASFNQNDINPNGSASWGGDKSYGKTAVITKNPMYIARFQDSFEQYNYWDSYEYNIDSVIFIPTESIANLPYEPDSIGIDGNNFNKKLVSSVFEPSRKMGVSYDQQQFKGLNLNTLVPIKGVGSSVEVGGGSIKYLTINGNAEDRLNNAISWSYNYKGLDTGSVQTEVEVQLAIRENFEGLGTKNYTGATRGFLLSGSIVSKIEFNQGAPGFIKNGTDQNYLEIGGPQLAVYHTYNQALADKITAPASNCPTNPLTSKYTGGTYAWTNQIRNYRDPQNYYSWSPSGSLMNDYEDTETPFLIQRGDVIRAEGTLQIDAETGLAQEYTNFVEDFTIMTIQNYYYSSSAELLTLNTGNDLSPVTGDTGRLFYANGTPIDGGNISAPIAGIVVSVPIGNASIGGATAIFTSDGTSITEAYINFGGYTGQFDPSTAGNNPGGFPTADYEVGDIFNIPSSALSALGVSQTITFKIQIRNMKSKISTTTLSTSVSDTGSENNFSLCTTNPYSCTSADPTYTQQCYPSGHFAVKYPTFLVTDRDPFEVLNGLNNGSVTRFTIRRQVEDETSVMAYNITPPSGSEGVNTLTGGGFLIPDDMSQTQKDNALNIINNLRAKRAFTGKQESGV
tara:strand:+ start:1743 stop:9152 length:7410 start_codon:yes stop_codon:yes gene_type:complete